MRVHGTYGLIEDRLAHANSPQPTLGRNQATVTDRTLQVQSQFIEMSSDKGLDASIQRLIL